MKRLIDVRAIYSSWKRSHKPSEIFLKSLSLNNLAKWFETECQNRGVDMELIDFKALVDPKLEYHENKQIFLDKLNELAPVGGEAGEAIFEEYEAKIARLDKKASKLEHGTSSQHRKHSRLLIGKWKYFVINMKECVKLGPSWVESLLKDKDWVYVECFCQHLKTGYPDLYDLHTQTENALRKFETETVRTEVWRTEPTMKSPLQEELSKLLSKLESEVDRLRLKAEYGTPLRGECDICKPIEST